MPAYSLSTSAGPIDLEGLSLSGHGRDESQLLRSVPSSRRGSEPIWSPAGLQADALRAAERVALDLLAATGRDQIVAIRKTLADGSSREDGSASASLSRDAGYAVVESHGRGARQVPIASIVERDGVRGFSAVVLLAQRVARAIAEGAAADDEILSIAAERGSTAQAVRVLVNHGVAAARIAADAARAGRSPAVARVLVVSEIV
jgi:hypothetical protein